MQIPIINGIYSDNASDIRVAYPVNMVPVPKQSGISEGYLRPADGLLATGSGPGVGRGGVVWNNVLYRVMDKYLVSIDKNGSVTVIGELGESSNSPVRMTYGFGRIAIASDQKLYYYDGSTLTEVTDPDLGSVVDMIWVDGYFMTTDGNSLVVTELTDPTKVNPLKYGSSEVDPDPIVSLQKIRNEVYAINRYTIEVFDNIGGDFFPFRRIDGAQMDKGAISTFACCVCNETLVFVGGGKDESIGVYAVNNSNATKISTQEIDTLLLSYTESQLQTIVLESRMDRSHVFVYVHLPDKTLVYDFAASEVMGISVWHVLTSSLSESGQYRGRYLLFAYNQWNVCDTQSSAIGITDKVLSHHWGSNVHWEFSTKIIYNESHGIVVHALELIGILGHVEINKTPTISTLYSKDGQTWSQAKYIDVGVAGSRSKRLVWFRQGVARNWVIQKFQSTSDAHIAISRLEATIEPLGV